MKTKPTNNRRDFLKLFTKPVQASIENEKIMLLTPDGKLVEVDKQIVLQAKSGSKVSNQEILTWSNSVNPKL
jgi:hypothetical protein